MKKRMAKFVRRGTLLGGFLAVGIVVVLGYMNYQDREHERFYQVGRSVNEFLKQYGEVFREGIVAHDVSPILSLYSDHYRSPDRGSWVLGPARLEGDVAVSLLQTQEAAPFDREELRRDLELYSQTLQSVDEVTFKINLIESMPDANHVVLTVKFVLDGRDCEGAVLQDRHFYRWELVNDAPAGEPREWKIVKDELVEGIRVAGSGRGFVEASLTQLGIQYSHERDPRLNPETADGGVKFGVIQHAGGGVSAVDYNNDGRADLFFADGKRCRLFRNEGTSSSGEVHFTDVTTAAGLEGIGAAAVGLFADVDNDGNKDLFLIRYCAPCLFFHNNGHGRFIDWTQQMKLDLNVPAMSACFLDYDRDGFLDVYVAVSGDAFHDIPRLPFFARNGGKNRLLRNMAGKHFIDVTDTSGAGATGWGMATAAGDIDNDGFPDLAVANDFGRKCLLHNNGNGTFSDITREAGVLDFSGGMGVVFGDVDDDGYLDVYFANINSNQRWFGEDITVNHYIRNILRSKWLLADFEEFRELHRLLGPRWRELGKMIGKGNSLFRNNRDGTFTELTDSNTHRAGWGWGVAFFDMYNSTRLDLYAANGWISNKPGTDL
jgi:hypothetical protein